MARQEPSRRLRGADVQTPVNLGRVHVDEVAIQAFGHGDGGIGLARRSGAEQHDNGHLLSAQKLTVQIRQGLHPVGRAAVIALLGVLGALHLPEQRVHLRQ